MVLVVRDESESLALLLAAANECIVIRKKNMLVVNLRKYLSVPIVIQLVGSGLKRA
jgi:hypothetical protein